MKPSTRTNNTLSTLLGKMWARLVPPSYKRASHVSILKWAALGLFIRVLFMPLTMHLDLLDIYMPIHWMVDRHHLNPIQPATPNWELVSLCPIVFYLLLPFLWVAETCFPSLRNVYNSPMVLPYVPYVPIETRWINTINLAYRYLGPQLFAVLFIIKIPYLMADFMTAFLLLRLIDEEKQAVFAFKFWMVNPVTIYSVFIWGDFSIIPVLCVVLSLYFVKTKKLFKSFLTLGLGVALKIFPLLFALPHALLLAKDKSKKALWVPLLILTSIAPYVLTALPFILTGDPSAFSKATKTGSPTFEYYISFRLQINPWGFNDWIFPFIIAYAFIVLKASSGTASFEKVWNTDMMILLSALAISFFHPYYFVWVAPLITMQLATDRRFLLLHLIQILCWFFYTFNYGRAAAMWLFAPISYTLLSWPSPWELIANLYDPATVINAVRSLFSAFSLWMVYKVITKEK